jgi:drug/metabolite transporter (DMT)-like permease
LGFAAFCLLAGSTWLLEGYFVAGWAGLFRVCFHDAVVCLALGGVGLARKERLPGRGLWEAAGWSAVLFALPPVVFAGAGSSVGSLTRLLVFALVPFLTVFFVAQKDGGDLRLLVPAAVALGGMALVVPFAWRGSGIGWLVGMVVAAGVVAFAGIRMHSLMRDLPVVWVAAAGSGAAALVAGVAWMAMERGPVDWSLREVGAEVGWGLVVDGPLVLLTMWLLREMQPVGFAARFLVMPLVTIVGGLVVMRPEVVWTTWVGLGLVVGGSWVLTTNDTGGFHRVGPSPGGL